jgi:DNA invertase Pin-like site-specific DNA recombinase
MPEPRLIGYARTSTLDQTAGLDAQTRDLQAVGCHRIFTEQVSSVDRGKRTALADALDRLDAGDTLVVTKLDRLARSVAHLHDLLGQITAKGAALRILSMGMDTATPTGKLLLTIMGGVAEFEREIMLERQREGIAKAKAEGKYKGRKPTARAKSDDVLALHAQGVGPTDIAKRLGIGRASVYRAIDAAKAGDAGSGDAD